MVGRPKFWPLEADAEARSWGRSQSQC